MPNLTTLSSHFVFFVVLRFSEVCQSQGGGESFCVKGDMLSLCLVIVLSVQGYSCRGHMEERWAVPYPPESLNCQITMADISQPVLWTRHCAEYLTWIIFLIPSVTLPVGTITVPSFADGETEAQSN